MKSKLATANLLVLGLAPLLVSGAEPEPAFIEEIVVTSEFRASAVDDTAGSVSVVSVGELQGRALTHLEDVLSQVPNVHFSGGSSRARYYQIRGIGERGQFEQPLNSSVGLLLDGVDLSGIGTVAVLHDVSQVEVLRGPQGTLYGANAMAGLIHVRTYDPTDVFEARLTLDAGNYDARGVGAVISGPLAEALRGRLALRQYRDDGFLDNVFLAKENTNERDELSLRAKLAWEPTDTLALGLSAGHVDVDNGYDAFSLDNDRQTRSDEPGRDAQESSFFAVTADWLTRDDVRVEAAVSHAASDIEYRYDEDWTYVGFHPDGYSSTDAYLRDRNTTTLDVRVLSTETGRIFSGTTDWVVGLYGLTQKVDFRREYTFFPAPFTSDFEIDRIALYGEITSEISDRARVTLGLRGERHESGYSDSEGVGFDPRDDLWGGRLVFEGDLSDGTLIYASAARGYKAGGFNPSNSLDPELRQYDPEILWNFELGLKGRWMDDRLSGRFALFHMERDDVQIGTSITRLREDGSSEFIQLTSNAAEGRNTGVEMEVTYAVTDALTLFGNLGLLRTEFEDFVNSSGEDLDGEDQAHAPDYQFFGGAEYRDSSGFYARVEIEGKDAFYYSDSRRFADNAEDLRSEPYELVNAAVGFERGRWDVRVWGRNLTDEDYTIRGFFFPNDPRDGYTERGWFQLGDPRRYGVTLNVRL